MDKHAFIFIGGLHRSGTTLLADCMCDHPQISGLTNTGMPMNEGQFLQNVYPPARTKRTLWPIRWLRPVAPDFLTSRGYGGPGRFGFDPGSMLDETSRLATPANARSIYDSWAPYWDTSRRFLLEKSPPNLVRTRLLQALFPNSYFIILHRHPVPVSYATRRWARVRPLHLLLEHWLLCADRARADTPHLERTISLRYEDFVRAPQLWLDRIYQFLGIDSARMTRSVSPSVNERYFEQWNRRLRSSGLRRRYAEFMKERYEARFNEYGYTLGDRWLEGPDAGLLGSAPADALERISPWRASSVAGAGTEM